MRTVAKVNTDRIVKCLRDEQTLYARTQGLIHELAEINEKLREYIGMERSDEELRYDEPEDRDGMVE